MDEHRALRVQVGHLDALAAEVRRLEAAVPPLGGRASSGRGARRERATEELGEAKARLFGEAVEVGTSWRVVVERLRQGDRAAVEPAVTFLEVDPTFHGSGYLKADLMHRLANLGELDAATRARLQRVVVARLERPQARLLTHDVRLAHAVWDETLAAEVERLATRGTEPAAGQARRLLHRRAHHGRYPADEEDGG